MGILVRDGGLWKDSEPHVRDSGVWKPVDTGFVKDAGVWKEMYASFSLPEVGDFWEGGYYAGIIRISGIAYAIIVAPKTLGGEASGTLSWNSNMLDSSPGTSSVNDGLANVNAMVASGKTGYRAAEFCMDLTISGHNDWYLPAKDELEILYRNLKPSTQANSTSHGSNFSSVPSHGNYDSNKPSQTSAALFKTGAAEAFSATDYWSSTQGASQDGNYYAWRQSFSTGSQNILRKHNGARVRAVRRVLVPEEYVPTY